MVKVLFSVLEPGNHSIEINDIDPRSNEANGYYWSVVVKNVFSGLKQMGFDEIVDEEDTHEFLKLKFAPLKVHDKSTGKTLVKGGSTKKMSKGQFNEYVEKIIRFASEYLSIAIPESIKK